MSEFAIVSVNIVNHHPFENINIILEIDPVNNQFLTSL